MVDFWRCEDCDEWWWADKPSKCPECGSEKIELFEKEEGEESK